MNIPLNLPEYEFKIRASGKNTYEIFDTTRRKYINLTPEEWVRQNFIQYLKDCFGYPSGLFSVEKTIVLNTMKIRPDIVIYSGSGTPFLIVECKAPSVQITQETFDQIAKYNLPLKVGYLAVTNGLKHYYCHLDYEQNSYTFIQNLPLYSEIKQG